MTGVAGELQLRIVTLSGAALDTLCESVRLPLVTGSASVYPGHAPMLALLAGGIIRWRRDGEIRYAAVSSGAVEVRDGRVALLVDEAQTAQSLEEARQYAARFEKTTP